MPVVAFIPVRGGSKSIPLKNIKSFCGKPLVYWNLEALQSVEIVTKIVVATDSQEIEDCVSDFGFSKVEIYRRSAANAQDQSSTEDVMLEYLSSVDLSSDTTFMLVQATSPLTQTEDFVGGLALFNKNEIDSVLSAVPFKRFVWNAKGHPLNYDYKHRPRRQDFNDSFLENGAFYINSVGNVLKHKNRLSGNIGVYGMPEYTSIEIDEPEDWYMAESIMKEHILSKMIDRKYSVKLFLSDVDGVLTDAGMYYSEKGDELKKFNTRDGLAFRLLKERGIKAGIITSEDTQIVKRRAEKLKLDYLYQGHIAGGKLLAALDICKQENISIEEVAYIGDDINCFELLSNVGFAACPRDAVSEIKTIKGINLLDSKGGEGAVREFVEYLIKNHLLAI